MTGLRAIMVCVDYADVLAITLPRNRHHFSEIMVVTSEEDKATQDLIVRLGVQGYVTDAFYRNGAKFNKWLAMEEGLDRFGRLGGQGKGCWICLMDADVIWPHDAPFDPQVGELWTPLRRMCHLTDNPPSEDQWHRYPLHRNVLEWAGYSQVFHTNDPHLPPPPWHETDWTHAGGADSIFQRCWPMVQKRRPSWEVLHLGEAGQNWYGRATPRTDGTIPPEAGDRLKSCSNIWSGRRALRGAGATEAEQFRPEKIGSRDGVC